MRLIDADRLKTTHEIQMGDFNSMESIGKWIDRQPTAYDVEAVVRELEKLRYYDDEYSNKCESTYNEALDDCIEIVKQGGRIAPKEEYGPFDLDNR